MEFVAAIGDSFWQFAAVFVIAALFFAYGASTKGVPMNIKTLGEIAFAAASIVLVFAFLSGGKGCTVASDVGDCRPAGPGIYNEC